MRSVDFGLVRRLAVGARARLDWRWSLLALVIVNMMIAAFVPIYIDEFVYKIYSARTFLERGFQISLYPQCPETFVTRLPLLLLPGGAIVALAWQNLTLLEMRLVGILMFGGWLALFHMLVRQLMSATHARASITLGAAALLSLGVTGFTMAISRPESFLVTGLTLLVLLPLTAPGFFEAARSALSQRLRIAGAVGLYFLVVSTMAFVHPNVVYFTPLVVVSVALMLRRLNWALILASITLLLWTIGVGILHTTRTLTTCSDPAFQGMANMYLVDLSGLWTQPAETLREMAWNAVKSLRQIVFYAAHDKNYQSDWLPPTPMLGWLPLSIGLRLAMEAIWYAIALAGVGALALRLWNWRSEASAAPVLLAASMLLGFGGLFAHARQLNFTIVQLALPMLVIFGVLTLAPWIPRLMSSRFSRPSKVGLTSLAALSVGLNLWFIAPQLIGPAFSATFFNNKQHHSYGAWNQQVRDDSTRRLANQCRIVPGDAPNLVIDDVSYHVFRHDRRPIFAMYVNPGHLGASLRDRLPAFLVEQNSSGYIGKCNYLWHTLHGVAIRDGDACCVSAETLRGLVTTP